MPRSQQTEEVQILKFFEEAPLERAELLFNIVKDKMRSRLRPESAGSGATRKLKGQRSAPNPADEEAKSSGQGGEQ